VKTQEDEVAHLSEELLQMFVRAEAALFQAFGADIFGSVHHSGGRGDAFHIRFDGQLTICGERVVDATLRHRIRAAKLMPELVEILLAKQERLLEDMKEAIASLEQFVVAFESNP